MRTAEITQNDEIKKLILDKITKQKANNNSKEESKEDKIELIENLANNIEKNKKAILPDSLKTQKSNRSLPKTSIQEIKKGRTIINKTPGGSWELS